MKSIEQIKKYALEQSDWIAHRNGCVSMKECVCFYHKGQVIFNPWLDLMGNSIEDPFSYYGKEKVDEFCRRIVAKKEGLIQDNQVTVDSNILEFLKMLYFGVTDNPFEAASRSAYTDMCRTIRFHGKNGDALRKSVDVLLEERIPELIDVDNSEKYTQWHYSICKLIVDQYEAEGIEFYMGEYDVEVFICACAGCSGTILPFLTYSIGQLYYGYRQETVWGTCFDYCLEQNIRLSGLLGL